MPDDFEPEHFRARLLQGRFDGHLSEIREIIDQRLMARARWKVCWEGRDWTEDDLTLDACDRIQKTLDKPMAVVTFELVSSGPADAETVGAVLTAISHEAGADPDDAEKRIGALTLGEARRAVTVEDDPDPKGARSTSAAT